MNLVYQTGRIRVFQGDCMEAMVKMKDKQFNLSIVDPPYGIDVANMNMGVGKGRRCPKAKNRIWKAKNWDGAAPSQDYFDGLFRVSKSQIIWGGNYFTLPPTKYFAVWDKGEGMYGRSFAECEYAWVSSGGTRMIKIKPVQKSRIHPTQKPVALYKWLLTNYAKPGDTILDTHGGSLSLAIACYDLGFALDAYEIDGDYVTAAVERLKRHERQLQLFRPETPA